MRKKRWGLEKERMIKDMLVTAKCADDALIYLQHHGFDRNEINLILQRFFSKSSTHSHRDGLIDHQQKSISSNEQHLELIALSQNVRKFPTEYKK